MPTIIIEHGLHVKEISCDGSILELIYLGVDELSEVLEVEERCQELLHLQPGREEPAPFTTHCLRHRNDVRKFVYIYMLQCLQGSCCPATDFLDIPTQMTCMNPACTCMIV